MGPGPLASKPSTGDSRTVARVKYVVPICALVQRLTARALAGAEVLGCGGEGGEAHVLVAAEVGDEALEHQHAVAAPDDLRVHRQVEDPAIDLAVHVVELVPPDLL